MKSKSDLQKMIQYTNSWHISKKNYRSILGKFAIVHHTKMDETKEKHTKKNNNVMTL